jgi:predicted RNase H-like HicB family nuclease
MITTTTSVMDQSTGKERIVYNEFTAIVEHDGEWFIAYSLEVQGANGQGRTKNEALQSLREAIALILKDRREDGLRGVPEDAIREKIVVE